DDRGVDDLAATGPLHLLALAADLAEVLARADALLLELGAGLGPPTIGRAEAIGTLTLLALHQSLRLSVHAFRGCRAGVISEQGRRDSNPQPPVLETGALPVELL